MEGEKEKLVPIGQAAELLGVSIDTVRRWDKKGVLHSQRPGGKDRYFSVSEIEQVKASRIGDISSVDQSFVKPTAPIYQTTGSYSSNDNDTPRQVSNPVGQEEVRQLSLAQENIKAQIDQNQPEINRFSSLRKNLSRVGLYLLLLLGVAVVATTISFMANPENTAKYLGYQSNVANKSSLSSASTEKPTNEIAQSVIYDSSRQSMFSKILRPISGLSLGILSLIAPDIYDRALPTPDISDASVLFSINSSGDVQSDYSLTFPDSTYLHIPDKNVIKNLNADYVRGKTPGANAGDLAYFDANNSIVGLRADTRSIVNQSVTTEKIADGAITQILLPRITSSNKVAGSAVQLSLSGGLTNNNGLSLRTNCSSDQVLAWNGSSWECQNSLTATGTLVYDKPSGVLTLNYDTSRWDASFSHLSNFSNPHQVTANQVLPSQTGEAGKILSTDGSGVSWIDNSSVTSWGVIVGTITDQSDLMTLIGQREPTLTKGDLTATGPLSFNATRQVIGGAAILSIIDAAADGSTKGAAAFTATEFNGSSGVISIDYTNAQSSDSTHKGFLSDTDWSTFNAKQAALGFTPANSTTTINGYALSSNISLVKGDIGLGNLDNLQQVPLSYLSTDITLGGVSPSDTKVSSERAVKSYVDSGLSGKEGSISAGTTLQYFRGDKSWQTLNTSVVAESGSLYYLDTRVDTRVQGQSYAITGSWTFNTATPQSSVTPSNANDLTNKTYVDNIASGIVPQSPVIDFYDPTPGTPGAPTLNDRHIASATANGWTIDHIYQWNGATWDNSTPSTGFAVYVTALAANYGYTGSAWVLTSNSPSHNTLSSLQGGTTGQYYHLTSAQYVVVGNTSNTNTGDETQATIKTKLGVASSGVDGYLSGANWTTFNGKQAALGFTAVANTTTVNGKALSGNITLDLASSDFANQGTTTTVLHGNAAGNPAFSAVVTNDITNNNITYAKLQQIAANSILGNNTGSAANAIELTGAQVKTMLSLAKADVGLGSVENTALSAWVGTANITTLGTITSGVWSGTTIVDAKIASALTGKTYNGLTLTSAANGFTIAGGSGKTLTASNTLTLTATDGSTLAIGGGGTLGTGAYATIGSYALVGQTMYIGTTAVAINRASAALTLAGLTLTTPNIGAATGTSVVLDTNTLVVDATNHRVGIGTTAPQTKLDILGALTHGGANNYDPTRMSLVAIDSRGYATGVGGGIGFSGVYNSGGDQAGLASIWGAKENATDGDVASYLGFGTRLNSGAVSERVRITSGGNVGIGTTTPTLAKLQVVGGIRSTFDTNYPTAEFAQLDVQGAATGDHPSNSRLLLGAFTAAGWPATGAISLWGGPYLGGSASGSALLFSASTNLTNNGTSVPTGTQMVLTNDGNVGIGTTVPDGKLDVALDWLGQLRVKKYAGSLTANDRSIIINGELFGSSLENTAPNVVGATFFEIGGSHHNGQVAPTQFNAGSIALRVNTVGPGSQYSSALSFRTVADSFTNSEATEKMTVLGNGNVGIGTASPGEMLEVNGTIKGTGYKSSDGTAGLASLPCAANKGIKSVTIKNGLITAATCTTNDLTDLAENYGSSDASIEAGDLVAASSTHDASRVNTENGLATKAYVQKASASNASSVIGIVSSNPEMTLGENLFTAGENPHPVALSGRVEVKVTNENGAIQKGDLLTVSSTPGFAAKVKDDSVVTVGTALEDFNAVSGQIIAFVNISHRLGTSTIVQMTNTGALSVDSITVAGDAIFKGVIKGNDKFAGKVTLPVGQTEIRVNKTWDSDPMSIVVTPSYNAKAWTETVDKTGFTIKVDVAPDADQTISWMAIFPQ